MNLKELKEPFPLKDIEWRVQQCGVQQNGNPWALVLAYIDARAVQDRLDDVMGQDKWKDEYSHVAGGVKCNLSLKPYDEWITKQDGSPETAVEAFKGGISKALVRAAVKWGIGRYLYNLSENFPSQISKERPQNWVKNGWHKGYHKDSKTTFYWIPPVLPKWALPSENKTDEKTCAQTKPTDPNNSTNEPSDKQKKFYFDLLKMKYENNIPDDVIETARNIDGKTMCDLITKLKVELGLK